MSRLPNVTNSMQAYLGEASICFSAFRHVYALSISCRCMSLGACVIVWDARSHSQPTSSFCEENHSAESLHLLSLMSTLDAKSATKAISCRLHCKECAVESGLCSVCDNAMSS